MQQGSPTVVSQGFFSVLKKVFCKEELYKNDKVYARWKRAWGLCRVSCGLRAALFSIYCPRRARRSRISPSAEGDRALTWTRKEQAP